MGIEGAVSRQFGHMDERRVVKQAYDEMAEDYTDRAGTDSLIHITLDDHRAVLEEFARVLRTEGTLLLTDGGMEWTGSNSDWLDRRVSYNRSHTLSIDTVAPISTGDVVTKLSKTRSDRNVLPTTVFVYR